jgi:hypothetical protein
MILRLPLASTLLLLPALVLAEPPAGTTPAVVDPPPAATKATAPATPAPAPVKAAPQIDPALLGRWTADCQDKSSMGSVGSFRVTLALTADGLARWEFLEWHLDNDCEDDPTSTWVSHGTWRVPGPGQLDLVLPDVTIEPWNQAAADSMNDYEICDRKDWKANVAVKANGLLCTASAEKKVRGLTLFTTFERKEDTLWLGRPGRGDDGGSGPESRATELDRDEPLFRKK